MEAVLSTEKEMTTIRSDVVKSGGYLARGLNESVLLEMINANSSSAVLHQHDSLDEGHTNSTQQGHIPFGYFIAIAAGVLCALLAVISILTVMYRRRKRPVLLPEYSIYCTQTDERIDWDDNLSFSYSHAGDSSRELSKQTTVGEDSFCDDSFLVSLNEMIDQRDSIISHQQQQRRHSAHLSTCSTLVQSSADNISNMTAVNITLHNQNQPDNNSTQTCTV